MKKYILLLTKGLVILYTTIIYAGNEPNGIYYQNEEPNKVVGFAETSVKGFDALGSLMADAMKDQMKVDFAFQNKESIKIISLPQGPITIKTIYQLDPSGNKVVILKMKINEIKSLITYAFNLESNIDLQVSGMIYNVTSDNQGHCLGVELFNDSTARSLDPSRIYTVAMNSNVASNYRFDHNDKGITKSITTTEVLINYLKEIKKINYSNIKRAFQTMKP